MRIDKNVLPIKLMLSFIGLLLVSSLSVAEPDKESAVVEDGMTLDHLVTIINEYAQDLTIEGANIRFIYNDAALTLVADPAANRMRIVSPIIEAAELTQEQMLAITVSNFHLALDARYAIGGNTLFATFIHPLKELSQAQVESAIRQVATLRNTFGSSYTSGEMSFGAGRQRGQDI